jgi:hypothetical protein
MAPIFKHFEDGEKFLVVGVVVQFGWHKAAREEGYGVDFTVRLGLREDCSDGIVRHVRLDNDRSIGVPMRQYWSGGERFLEFLK